MGCWDRGLHNVPLLNLTLVNSKRHATASNLVERSDEMSSSSNHLNYQHVFS